MNKKIITIASRLITMEQVRAIEQAMIEFGVNDPYSRPMYYAQNYVPDSRHTIRNPLAAVFLYLQVDEHDPTFFQYEFDAGYCTHDIDRELVQPDTFLAMVRFATLLKQGH